MGQRGSGVAGWVIGAQSRVRGRSSPCTIASWRRRKCLRAVRRRFRKAVDELVASLKHPLGREIDALRAIILSASPTITEGVKWNSPSFYAGGWFATIHTRASDSLQLILHLGAKVKDANFRAPQIKDDAGLLKWLGKDRAVVRYEDMKGIRATKAALQAILRQWVAA